MGSKLILLLGLIVGGLLTFFCVNKDKREELFNYKNLLNKSIFDDKSLSNNKSLSEVKQIETKNIISKEPTSVAIMEENITKKENIENIEMKVDIKKEEIEKLKDTEDKISKLLADNPIYFKINSSTIKEESKKELNMIIGALKEISTKTVIVIKGHTDAVGKASLNKKLSQKRAEAIMIYLKKGGVGNFNMRAIGYGEEQPIVVSNPNDKLNRRVEIELKRGE